MQLITQVLPRGLCFLVPKIIQLCLAPRNSPKEMLGGVIIKSHPTACTNTQLHVHSHTDASRLYKPFQMFVGWETSLLSYKCSNVQYQVRGEKKLWGNTVETAPELEVSPWTSASWLWVQDFTLHHCKSCCEKYPGFVLSWCAVFFCCVLDFYARMLATAFCCWYMLSFWSNMCLSEGI